MLPASGGRGATKAVPDFRLNLAVTGDRYRQDDRRIWGIAVCRSEAICFAIIK
jgi:hypothetical protein